MKKLLILTLLLIPTITRADLSSGLVGYWSMNTRDGASDIFDRSLNNLPFSPVSSPVKDSGSILQSYTFDGSTNYFQYSSKVNNLSGGAILAWVKLPNTAIDTDGEARAILTYGGNAATNACLFGMRVQNTTGTKRLVIIQRTNGGASVIIVGNDGTVTLDDNKWHMVGILSSGTSYAVYIDGVVQTLNVLGGSNNGNWFSDTTCTSGVSRIGALRFNGNDIQQFLGSIDDVRIYDRLLSQNEIYQFYRQGLMQGKR